MGNECTLKLSIFADESHGNLSDGGSHLGCLVILVEDDGSCLCLNWQWKRIKGVVTSNLAEETLDGQGFIYGISLYWK